MKQNTKTTAEANIFANSHRLWISDLKRCFEYVDIDDRNLNTFSHRFFELQLRACTEFESIAKALITNLHLSRKKNPTIKEFAALSDPLKLPVCSLDLHLWNPEPKHLTPFDGWSIHDFSLSWYQNYNKIKHNRVEQFAKASLGNTIIAGAGVFVLLAQGYGPDRMGSTLSASYGSTGTSEYRFRDFPYTFQRPTDIFSLIDEA